MCSDDFSLSTTIFARKPGLFGTGFLNKIIEGLAAVEKLVPPVIAVIDKNKEAGTRQSLRYESLCFLAFFPFPAAVQRDSDPALVLAVEIDALTRFSGLLKRSSALLVERRVSAVHFCDINAIKQVVA